MSPMKQRDRWQVVAETVRFCMDDIGMRQADLVRESGLSDPTIRSFMTAKFRGEPQPHTIRKVEAALLWPPGAIARILAGEDPGDVLESKGSVSRSGESVEVQGFRAQALAEMARQAELLEEVRAGARADVEVLQDVVLDLRRRLEVLEQAGRETV